MTNFEKNVYGLDNDVLYSDYDDYYDYPTQESKYNDYSHHMNQLGHSSKNPNPFNNKLVSIHIFKYITRPLDSFIRPLVRY